MAHTRKWGFDHINFPVLWEMLYVWVEEGWLRQVRVSTVELIGITLWPGHFVQEMLKCFPKGPS